MSDRRCPNVECNEDLTDPDTGYSKVTLVEVRGVYDGGLFLAHMTDECGFAWHRWVEPSMRDKAQKYIDQWNERRGFAATSL